MVWMSCNTQLEVILSRTYPGCMTLRISWSWICEVSRRPDGLCRDGAAVFSEDEHPCAISMEGAKRLTRDLMNEGCVSMKSCPYTLFIYVVILFEHPGPEFVRSLVGLTASVETAP